MPALPARRAAMSMPPLSTVCAPRKSIPLAFVFLFLLTQIQHPRALDVLDALRVAEPGDALYDVADPLCLLEDDERLLILLAAIVELHQEELGVTEERRERIVDLMLQRDGRLADAGAPPRDSELRFGLATRDVLRAATFGNDETRPQLLG